MTRLLLCLVTLALVLPAGASDQPPGIVFETGSVTALNSTLDLGLSLSVGTVIPEWVPVVSQHLGFVDLLTVGGEEAIGLSVSLQRWETDDGWRIGATVTQPDEGQREVLGYLRYGVAIKF